MGLAFEAEAVAVARLPAGAVDTSTLNGRSQFGFVLACVGIEKTERQRGHDLPARLHRDDGLLKILLAAVTGAVGRLELRGRLVGLPAFCLAEHRAVHTVEIPRAGYFQAGA